MVALHPTPDSQQAYLTTHTEDGQKAFPTGQESLLGSGLFQGQTVLGNCLNR
jgi:hypothetical protein